MITDRRILIFIRYNTAIGLACYLCSICCVAGCHENAKLAPFFAGWSALAHPEAHHDKGVHAWDF